MTAPRTWSDMSLMCELYGPCGPAPHGSEPGIGKSQGGTEKGCMERVEKVASCGQDERAGWGSRFVRPAPLNIPRHRFRRRLPACRYCRDRLMLTGEVSPRRTSTSTDIRR